MPYVDLLLLQEVRPGLTEHFKDLNATIEVSVWFIFSPPVQESLPLDHVEVRPSQFSLTLSCK